MTNENKFKEMDDIMKEIKGWKMPYLKKMVIPHIDFFPTRNEPMLYPGAYRIAKKIVAKMYEDTTNEKMDFEYDSEEFDKFVERIAKSLYKSIKIMKVMKHPHYKDDDDVLHVFVDYNETNDGACCCMNKDYKFHEHLDYWLKKCRNDVLVLDEELAKREGLQDHIFRK